jgi:hypothetical protein
VEEEQQVQLLQLLEQDQAENEIPPDLPLHLHRPRSGFQVGPTHISHPTIPFDLDIRTGWLLLRPSGALIENVSGKGSVSVIESESERGNANGETTEAILILPCPDLLRTLLLKHLLLSLRPIPTR